MDQKPTTSSITSKLDKLMANTFAKIDNTKTGLINEAQFKEYAMQKYGMKSYSPRISDVFNEADVNGRGSIDYNQFKTALGRLQTFLFFCELWEYVDGTSKLENHFSSEKISQNETASTVQSEIKKNGLHGIESKPVKTILVKCPTRKVITLEVDGSTTIASIKAKLHQLSGIATNLQRLVYGKQNLEDLKTLSDYKISDKSMVYLVLRLKQQVEIDESFFIKVENSTPFQFYFDSARSIGEVKSKINKLSGIPVENQELTFKGNILQDNDNLHTCHLTKQGSLYLKIREKTAPMEPQSKSTEEKKDIIVSNSETVHKVEVKEGDLTDVKTKFEIKYFAPGKGDAEGANHIPNKLQFSEDSVGIIIKIQSKNPSEAAEQMQQLIDDALLMAEAVLPVNSIAMQILSQMEVEVTHDKDVISIGAKVKDDWDNVFLLAALSRIEQFFQNYKQYVDIGVELKHDLKSFFKENIPLNKVIKDGIRLFLNFKTNHSEQLSAFFKEIAKEDDPYFERFYSVVQMFLKENSNISLSLSTIGADNLIENLSNIDSFAIRSFLNMNMDPFKQLVSEPPVAILGTLFELMKDYLSLNFSVSLKLADLMLFIHFKTAGVKELF